MSASLLVLPWPALNHIALPTAKLADTEEFYRAVLGFRPVERPNFSYRGAWLFKDGLMLHLIERAEGSEPASVTQTRQFHVALHSDNLDATAELLTARGFEFRRGQIPDRAIAQIFFQDPNGFHWEMGTYPATPPFIDE